VERSSWVRLLAQGTAERALAMVREEGLIRSAMGRGHFTVRRG